VRMDEEKYYELDKSVSKEIMSQLKGKIIPVTCWGCGGKGKFSCGEKCDNCKGDGYYEVQY
jgi:DnaJ-class molecular chaperone